MGRLLEALSAVPFQGHTQLRPLAHQDVDWVARAGDDPEIVKWNGLSCPFARHDAAQLISLRQSQWESDQRATFAIGDHESEPGGYLSLRVTWARGIGEVGY
jgi:hypothetical protein